MRGQFGAGIVCGRSEWGVGSMCGQSGVGCVCGQIATVSMCGQIGVWHGPRSHGRVQGNSVQSAVSTGTLHVHRALCRRACMWAHGEQRRSVAAQGAV
eukprot:g12422.t1